LQVRLSGLYTTDLVRAVALSGDCLWGLIGGVLVSFVTDSGSCCCSWQLAACSGDCLWGLG